VHYILHIGRLDIFESWSKDGLGIVKKFDGHIFIEYKNHQKVPGCLDRTRKKLLM
jgi:hypothetical protein